MRLHKSGRDFATYAAEALTQMPAMIFCSVTCVFQIKACVGQNRHYLYHFYHIQYISNIKLNTLINEMFSGHVVFHLIEGKELINGWQETTQELRM